MIYSLHLFYFHIFRILSQDCVLLSAIGEHVPYELAVGMNGRLCLRCGTVSATIATMNAIVTSEYMRNDEITKMVEETLKGLT